MNQGGSGFLFHGSEDINENNYAKTSIKWHDHCGKTLCAMDESIQWGVKK